MAKANESFLPPLWLLTLFAVAFVLWALVALKELVVLLVVSYAVAYIIDPALDWLESRRVPRSYGVLLVTIVLLLFILLLIVSAVPTLIEEYQKIINNLPAYLETARDRSLPWIEKIRSLIPEDQIQGANGEAAEGGLISNLIKPDAINAIFAGLFATLLKGYSLTLTIVNLLLLPFIVYYIAVDFDVFHKTVLGLFPKGVKSKVSDFFMEINHYVSAFVRGQLTVCSILFVLYALGLWLVGVELWFLLAVISGFGNLIPYVGFLTGIVLSSVMALVTFGDFSHLLQVFFVFAIVQSLEGFLITPKVIGSSVGLSPLIIIIALFIGGQAFGLLGIFLAVPGAAIFRVSLKRMHRWVLSKA